MVEILYGPGLMIKSSKAGAGAAEKRNSEMKILDKLADLGERYDTLRESGDVAGLKALANDYKQIRRGQYMAERIMRQIKKLGTDCKQEQT